MIRKINGKGVNRANVACDTCGRIETVTCDYFRKAGNEWTPNEGQVLKKMAAQKWAIVKGKHLCPTCDAKRRAKPQEEASDMTNKGRAVTDLRQPSREQKRQIADMLRDVYDLDRGRYVSGETDATVAEVLGGGVMPVWVAEIREEFFGPDGGNDDMAETAAEIAAKLGQIEMTLAEADAAQKAVEHVKAALSGQKVDLQAMA
ncbi:hypothetical protein, partial [Mangrovicoccus sp. HB161399]|uniref:hypothetical protein n=1 Tax=Mangrovicoccus sp. HB161399 TaxID=2720392 RepID=UPI001552B940